MPRRPSSSKNQSRASGSKPSVVPIAEPNIDGSEWEDEESDAEALNLYHEPHSGSGSEEDAPLDAPRIAQWEDDEDFQEDLAEDLQPLSGIVRGPYSHFKLVY